MNRLHQEYVSFKPEKRVVESAEQKHEASIGDGRQSSLQLEVVEIYKPSTHVIPVFLSVGADTGKFYIASEVTDVVFR